VCLENGGKTIAVLGWGIDRKVVNEDEKLYRKILEVDSLIVSEYEGKEEAELWMFPARNRIVAGITDAVLVIEGAEKSGSLITARLANKFGVPLLALPGSVFSRVSVGTNGLIKSGKARLVSNVEDVLECLGLTNGQLKMDFDKKKTSSPVLAVLESGEKSVDELARCLKIPVEKIMEEIMQLEIEGEVRIVDGKVVLACV
jgi:DNA processing protein